MLHDWSLLRLSSPVGAAREEATSRWLGYIFSWELMESCNCRAVSISISSETHFSHLDKNQKEKKKNPFS